MIEDIGRVVKLIGRKAAVEVERTSACAQCGLQEVEDLAMGGKVVLEAVNVAQAKVGDTVRVRVESVAYMKAVAEVFGIPVLLLLLGTAGGMPLAARLGWEVEPTSAALGLLGLAWLALAWSAAAEDPSSGAPGDAGSTSPQPAATPARTPAPRCICLLTIMKW